MDKLYDINPLQPSGYYTYHQFNIHQFYVLPTQCIYVFCVDLRKKQRLFPYTTLTGWFLQERFNPVKPSGHYVYRQFNIH